MSGLDLIMEKLERARRSRTAPRMLRRKRLSRRRAAAKGAKVGDVHTWADGSKHQKMPDGTWKTLPKGAESASPETSPEEPKTPDVPEVGPKEPRKWIDHLEGLPQHTVLDHWSEDEVDWSDPRGPWVISPPSDPERRKLHDEIKRKFLAGTTPVPPGIKPVAVFTMGGPSSGKSSLLEQEGATSKYLDNAVRIDCDKIKEQIPEYQKAIDASAKDAAKMVHAESAYVMGDLREQAVEERRNVIIDGTGVNATDYRDQMERFKARGYHVVLAMPQVDKAKAMERGAMRAEKEGRWVPEHIYHDAYDRVQKNFLDIQDAANEAYLFDTNDFPPTLKWQRSGTETQEHDPEWMSNFRSGAGKIEHRDLYQDLRSLLEEDPKEDPAYWSSNKIRDGLVALLTKGEEKQKALKSKPTKFAPGEGVEMVWDTRI